MHRPWLEVGNGMLPFRLSFVNDSEKDYWTSMTGIWPTLPASLRSREYSISVVVHPTPLFFLGDCF